MFPLHPLSSKKGFLGQTGRCSGRAGTGRMEAAWPEHAVPCLGSGSEGACCLLQQLPTCHCGWAEKREWLRSSFWDAAPISTSVAAILNVVSYLYVEFYDSQVDKLGSSQQTGWWPQLLLSSVLHEGWDGQHWKWEVWNWVIFISYLVNKGCDI